MNIGDKRNISKSFYFSTTVAHPGEALNREHESEEIFEQYSRFKARVFRSESTEERGNFFANPLAPNGECDGQVGGRLWAACGIRPPLVGARLESESGTRKPKEMEYSIWVLGNGGARNTRRRRRGCEPVGNRVPISPRLRQISVRRGRKSGLQLAGISWEIDSRNSAVGTSSLTVVTVNSNVNQFSFLISFLRGDNFSRFRPEPG